MTFAREGQNGVWTARRCPSGRDITVAQTADSDVYGRHRRPTVGAPRAVTSTGSGATAASLMHGAYRTVRRAGCSASAGSGSNSADHAPRSGYDPGATLRGRAAATRGAHASPRSDYLARRCERCLLAANDIWPTLAASPTVNARRSEVAYGGQSSHHGAGVHRRRHRL